MEQPKNAEPTYKDEKSGGLDLKCTTRMVLAAGELGIMKTEFEGRIPTGCIGLIISRREELANGIHVLTGVANAGISEGIRVHIKNDSGGYHSWNRGDPIAQLVVVPCIQLTDFWIEDTKEK